MDKLKISCPCLFGLESVLSGEMKRMGAENISAEDGRVTFEGSFEDAARANLRLRTAERVQIIVAEFTARSYEELFQGTLAAPWEEFIGQSSKKLLQSALRACTTKAGLRKPARPLKFSLCCFATG